MFYSLVNKVIRFNLRKYIEELFATMEDPKGTQNDVLEELLAQGGKTSFGKGYGIDSATTPEEFAKKMPLHEYGDLEPYIQRMRSGEADVLWPGVIDWYAKSSGTTSGVSKFIPISEQNIKNCHFIGGRYELALYFNQNPEAAIFEGLGLRLGGSTAIEQHGKSRSGDLSAILIEHIPMWAEFRSAPSPSTALMSDWEEKIDAILDEVIQQNITSLWGVSSWFLVLFEKILERTGKSNLLEVWPNLELFAHGGVNFAPYESTFRALMPGDQVTFMENYNASEGFFAIQDNPADQGMLLLLNSGIYYEFIPMSEYQGTRSTTIALSEVELDTEYAMVITTNSGLWRYILGDTVTFTSRSPYRVKVSGRTAHFINAFGEEVIVTNAEEALKAACERCTARTRDFHAAPVFMDQGRSGAHQWIIEFDELPNNLVEFSHTLDQELQKRNSDYAAKRQGNLVLSNLQIVVAQDRLFHHWLKAKGKLGGQNKIPRLANNRKLMEEYLTLNEALQTNLELLSKA